MLLECLKKFETESVNMTEISLGHLHKEHVVDIVADMLRISHIKARPLADFVHKHTDGHALFVVRLLEYFRQKEFIYLSHNNKSQWEWDLDRITNAGVPDTLEGILADEMVRMPETTRNFLKTAAAIGLFFDDFTTDLILSSLEEDSHAWSLPTTKYNRQEALRQSLQCSMERGFIRSAGNGSHQFNHDKMWQASYNLIPEKERDHLHLQIGRRLLHTLRSKKADKGRSNKDTGQKRSSTQRRRYSDVEYQTRQLFVTVDQLNRGKVSFTVQP